MIYIRNMLKVHIANDEDYQKTFKLSAIIVE